MADGLWMVAAENGAIAGGKVGGVGDVIRDLPPVLARLGWRPRVITPAYGRLHKAPNARLLASFTVDFGGQSQDVQVFELVRQVEGVETCVIDHPLLDPRGDGQIYHADAHEGPYETDATRFAFFAAAVAAWVEHSERPPQRLHLHDWHAGFVAALRASSPGSALARARLVFTIHNLAYQGVRPYQGSPASLAAWFPGFVCDPDQLRDPRYPDCVNFMATAIRLADTLSTVSPTYAKEILGERDPAAGFGGGEGLAAELDAAAAQGRLSGILNGCDYPEAGPEAPQWGELMDMIAAHPGLLRHAGGGADRLRDWSERRPEMLLLSIGRVVAQKVSLFLAPVPGHPTALDAILSEAGDAGVILLGNGEAPLEQQLVNVASRHRNFIYLRGYAEALSGPLYAAGDLFLMPSSFEPCGISQMLAMRAGQPCVAHAVGGLRDTIDDGRTGFLFGGDTPAAQAEDFRSATHRALALKRERPAAWRAMRNAAARMRFDWTSAARAYTELYR